MTKKEDRTAEDDQAQVLANQAPDTKQPGVSTAEQDYAEFARETPGAPQPGEHVRGADPATTEAAECS